MLIDIAKSENFTHNESYLVSAIVIACIGAPLYCIVRDVSISTASEQ